jgi:hypothetical protein
MLEAVCLRSKRSEVRILSGVPTLKQNQSLASLTLSTAVARTIALAVFLTNFGNQLATTPQSRQRFRLDSARKEVMGMAIHSA